mmetsp:Transcript_3172/g.6585  ORF Transcript_3172/g.6585 Transcript_3172/m.6585 type:complete len:253 (+) Transcript_3172:199-957(+)
MKRFKASSCGLNARQITADKTRRRRWRQACRSAGCDFRKRQSSRCSFRTRPIGNGATFAHRAAPSETIFSASGATFAVHASQFARGTRSLCVAQRVSQERVAAAGLALSRGADASGANVLLPLGAGQVVAVDIARNARRAPVGAGALDKGRARRVLIALEARVLAKMAGVFRVDKLAQAKVPAELRVVHDVVGPAVKARRPVGGLAPRAPVVRKLYAHFAQALLHLAQRLRAEAKRVAHSKFRRACGHLLRD